jgi:hypothetical protein
MGLPCSIPSMKQDPTMQQATRPSTEDSAKEIEAMARAAALLLDAGDLKSAQSVGRLLLAIEQRAAELARNAST